MSDYSTALAQNAIGQDNLDDPIVIESVGDFSGGEDSFRRSTIIDPNQCQHLLNVIVRDNFEARTRPGADSIPTANTKPITNATAVHALKYFDTPSKSQLLASVAVSNTPNFLKYEGGAWTDLSGSYAPASADARLAMAQGVDKVLIGDGSANQLKIYDGTNFTNAGNTSADAPIGATILCWHTSRMFASGVSASPDTVWVSNFLTFAAGQWDSTNRSFRIGGGDGDPIVALASMQQFTLAVLKRNSVWLVTTNPEKDSSGTAGFAASQVTQGVASGIGCVGRDAWCSYGNDILFFAQDGIRSVQRMQAAAGQWQLSAPLSQPIQPIIDRVNRSAWSKIAAIKYEEFAFFFVPLDSSTTNNAVLIWNGRLGKWIGTWDNWKGLCCEQTRFSGITRFVFGDSTGLVNQWKDNISTNSVTDDATYTDNAVAYRTQVWTKSWQFGESLNNKTAYNAVCIYTAGNAPINLTLMTDLASARGWVNAIEPTGDILGTDVLPFLLQSQKPARQTKGLRGLPEFNEAYLRIESPSGWFFLRSVNVSAMINPMKET